VSGAAAALLLVTSLAAAGVLLARRRRAPGVAPLAVALRQPLGKESGVAVVRWRGEELLVGYGTGGVVRLAAALVGDGRGAGPGQPGPELQR
jgi:hypothetical protein